MKVAAAEGTGMDDVAGIFAREFPALDGHAQVGVAQGRVISVDFPARPQDDARPDHDLLDRVGAYLNGEPDDFRDVTVALTLPTDQRRVLEALREVPYGETVTVGQLARMTAGLDDEAEADLATVRDALRGNPTPILVGDHRVRDASGATPAEVAAVCRRVEGL
jgi:methylated-DNA-[protein]-cysteine S-methyltransferase